MSAVPPSAHVQVDGLSITVSAADGGRKAIVADVSFAIPKGEVLALIGQSGSGRVWFDGGAGGYSRASSCGSFIPAGSGQVTP